MPVELFGHRYSVYSWIARLAPAEKGVAHGWTEINPFDEDMPAAHLKVHPFRRVPALKHGGFVFCETDAITRHIDEAFPGPSLQANELRARARVSQIVSVVDSYGYWPLVRQVFSHGFFRPRLGRPADEAEFRKGPDASPRVLGALDALAGDGSYLFGNEVSLADVHFSPMIAYFTMAPEGPAVLATHGKLQAWWGRMVQRPSVAATRPEFPLERT